MLKKELKEGLLRELKEGERIDPDVDYFVVRKDEHMEEVLERLKERLKKTKKVWTSDNCPMDIAWIPSSELHLRNPDGKIGICMCPGRNKPKKRHVWQRDLSKDLDRMKQVYGCDVLVTLIRRQEMEEMRLLDNFFPEVDKHAIESFWLPIKDKWIPNSMIGLMNLVERILMRLHQGKRVVVHCNGGKGRSATVIVATMVALGRSIGESTNIIQSTRGGTLRNPLQQAYLRRFKREWKERRKERERRYKRRLKSRKKKDKDMMKAMVKVRVMEEISRLTSQQQQSSSSSFSAPPSTATTPAMTKKNNSSNNNPQQQMLVDARKRTSLAAEDERRLHTEKEESEKEDKAKPTKEEDKDKESHLKMVKTFKRKKRKGLFNKKLNSSSLNMKASWGESSQSQSSCSESEDEDDSLAVFLRTREELVEEVQALERKVASAEVKLQERKLRLAQAKKELEQFVSVDVTTIISRPNKH
ncbi:Cyclin-dependent kinase inhibitor 3 [Balamuthia mandrillaris]